MYIALLGRQPALSIAELESLYGAASVDWFSDQAAIVDGGPLSVEQLGGSLKVGRVVVELPHSDWRRVSTKIVQMYHKQWHTFDGKITLGISTYDYAVSPREVQKTGLLLKQKLKQAGVSLRLIPNQETALSTATSHHNKLGLSHNKVELLIFRGRNGKTIIAESLGAQNITALARRDQERPKRDAFVGMLPPKLAQIMINLAGPLQTSSDDTQVRLLDPFCGTGVILQEASLMRYAVYGTDLSEKMIRYSRDNLQWLQETHHLHVDWYLHEGDAMTTTWQQPIDAVVCESYLGQPFSAPPSPAKLVEVRGNCDHIITSFLKNIAPQLQPGVPLVVAVPAWRDNKGQFTHLPLIGQLDKLGYQQARFKNVRTTDLLYYREDQIVGRELLVLTKK